MGARLLSWPAYPVLLSLVPLLDLFAGNVHRLRLQDVMPTLLLLAACTALLQVILSLVLRDKHRAAFATSAIVIALFFLRYPIKWIVELDKGSMVLLTVLVFWTLAFTFLIHRTLRSRFASAGVTSAANVLVSLPLLVVVAELTLYSLANPEKPEADLASFVAGPLPSIEVPKDGPQRDIYYIVLDRYANAEQLRAVYGFDNGPFLAELSALGFRLPGPAAQANYQRTAHSLASSLNLNYLDDLTTLIGERSDNWRPLYGLLGDSQVSRFLKREGYSLLHFGSWWNPTRENAWADENHNWWAPPDYLRVHIDRSYLGFLGKILGSYALDTRRQQCDRIRHKFEMLKQVSARPGRKFVFAHILLPHPPFVFGADGTCLKRSVVAKRSRGENYLDQVAFANDLVLDLIRTIRRNAEREPIIVLQADEGPWPAPYAGNEIDGLGLDVKAVDWTRASDAELREKIGILNAFHLPGLDPDVVYPGMTPVNTFRVIFNHYFGTALPLLPDRSYVFRDNDRLYSFMDVTDRLASGPPSAEETNPRRSNSAETSSRPPGALPAGP